MATVCAKSMSLRRLLSTAYTTDLMLILMYGILMNVCCCFNSVLNLANGLHIETNWLRSRKRVGFFSLLYTMPHRCKDELLLFSYFMGLCAVVDFFLLSNDYRLVFWRNAWIQWLFSFKNIYWFQYFVRVAYKLLWPLAFWTLCWCKCASNWPKRAKINEYFAKMWNFGMTMAQAARQKGRIGSVGTAC